MKFHHTMAAAALVSLLGAAAAQLAWAQNPDSGNWVGSWGFVPLPMPPGTAPMPSLLASPLSAPPAPAAAPPTTPLLLDNPGNVPVITALYPDVANATFRQLVRVSGGGRRIRLRLTNEAGAEAMVFDDVHVGIAGPDCVIAAGSDRAVTFDGHPGVTMPASSPVLSDPIDLPVNALDKLCISIHAPLALPRGGHTLYQYLSGEPGDHAGDAQLPHPFLTRLPAFVSEVEVDAPGTNVVVAYGDSITEGATSTNNAFRSWPDRLAERLAADKAGRKWAVVNAAISGNRLLRYGAGPSALARLDRDVLSVPGAKVLILLEGINDIGRGFTTVGPTEPVTAEALEAADRQIIARCHEHGIKVIGALLTPYKGAGYASEAGEQVREALNNWIRTGGAFDGVVDFATPVADPSDPLTFAPQFNIRDHLHPNDAGYRVMGDAIDLKLITGGK